jgi:AraC-like DNA-binding protein
MSENKGTPAQILDIRGEAYTKYVVKFLLAIHTSPYYCYGMTDHLSRINGMKPDLPGFITETQEDTSKRQATKDVRKDSMLNYHRDKRIEYLLDSGYIKGSIDMERYDQLWKESNWKYSSLTKLFRNHLTISMGRYRLETLNGTINPVLLDIYSWAVNCDPKYLLGEVDERGSFSVRNKPQIMGNNYKFSTRCCRGLAANKAALKELSVKFGVSITYLDHIFKYDEEYCRVPKDFAEAAVKRINTIFHYDLKLSDLASPVTQYDLEKQCVRPDWKLPGSDRKVKEVKKKAEHKAKVVAKAEPESQLPNEYSNTLNALIMNMESKQHDTEQHNKDTEMKLEGKEEVKVGEEKKTEAPVPVNVIIKSLIQYSQEDLEKLQLAVSVAMNVKKATADLMKLAE